MELSKAFFSSMPIRKKLNKFVVIIVGIFMAAIVKSSSTILLILKLACWPADNTHLWINAIFDELWSKRLNDFIVPQHCSIASNLSNSCPFNERQAIGIYLFLANNIIPSTYQGPPTISSFPAQLTSQSSLRQFIIQHHIYKNASAGYDREAT